MKVLRRQSDLSRSLHRRGSIMPAMVIAILVTGSCLALVLDTLWLRMARAELQNTADAAALAAARELACDELLTNSPNTTALADRVRQSAANVAGHNTAAGRIVYVNPLEGTDVAIGHVVLPENSGSPVFLETDLAPRSVVVLAHCDRRSGNPVGLFFSNLTGQSTADLQARAEASVNNRLLGVRPLDKATVPALPLGILELHTDPRRTDTWMVQIEGRLGPDSYRFNSNTNEVEAGSDGLPEIELHSTLRGNEEEEEKRGNVQLIDLGTELKAAEVVRQIETGWRWQDLQRFGSEFRTDQGPVNLNSLERIEGAPVAALEKLVGQVRIVTLYHATGPGLQGGRTNASVQRLVAVRIMSVREQDSSLKMVVQPAVIATRTALVLESLAGDSSPLENPYIYRLSLTY